MEEHPEDRPLVALPDAPARPLWQRWHVSGASRQILLAVLVSAASLGVRWALDPWLGQRQPFTPAFAAIAIAAWFANWRAGLVAAVLCHLWANYFFIEPRHAFAFGTDELVGAGFYYLTAGVILFLGHSATAANRSLADMVGLLRKVDVRKTEFLALLGHELRNPLATIRTSVELLKTGALDPADTRYAIDMMERQASQMTRLIEDLLDISRIDQGKIVLHTTSVAVMRAVADAVEAARTFTEPMGQVVAVKVPPDVETVEADPARVTQVLTNLLHNASKFSPRGSRIEVSARPVDGQVAITVRDHGIGIAEDQLDSIFGSFVQLEPGAGGQPGLGLGLSLVRKLMDMLGGSVRARSEGTGKGSEFTVLFPRGASPVAPSAEPSPAARAPAPVAAADSLRLMVVDDNRDAAESLAMLLQLKGHHVITANNGPAALRQVARETPDIIFLDLGMPDMDGFEVAHRLRMLTKGRQPALVALTGWGGEDDQRRSRDAGFDRHLTKPVSMEALEQALLVTAPAKAPETASSDA
jgi:signal transduction histidine kinase/ActR/RegA family two-component response regulator